MSSFTFRLKKLILSNGTPCDMLKNKSYNCFPSSKKTAPMSSNAQLSMNEMNTFLIKSPQSIVKEKKLSYITVFRSGSMKDLHRESYLNDLTTMKSQKNLTRNDSFATQKLKTKVESYTSVLKDEQVTGLNSPSYKKSMNKEKFIFKRHFDKGDKKKVDMLKYGLNNYAKNHGCNMVNVPKNTTMTSTALFGRSMVMNRNWSNANLSLLRTSTSSYISPKNVW